VDGVHGEAPVGRQHRGLRGRLGGHPPGLGLAPLCEASPSCASFKVLAGS